MNLIEKWKNRVTKKKLLEENLKLKEQLEIKAINTNILYVDKKRVEELCVTHQLPPTDNDDIPSEYIKRSAEQSLLYQLLPYIDYKISEGGILGGKTYSATVYVVAGDKKNEQSKT